MILYIHKEKTDALSMINVTNKKKKYLSILEISLSAGFRMHRITRWVQQYLGHARAYLIIVKREAGEVSLFLVDHRHSPFGRFCFEFPRRVPLVIVFFFLMRAKHSFLQMAFG